MYAPLPSANSQIMFAKRAFPAHHTRKFPLGEREFSCGECLLCTDIEFQMKCDA